MNWEAVGAIGEIVGALAVVITLVYLAIQTRTNTKAILGSSNRDVLLTWAMWQQEVAANPELMRIVMKSMQPELQEYSAQERQEFMTHMLSLLQILQAGYLNQELDLSHKGVAAYIKGVAGIINQYPAWQKGWEEWAASDLLDDEFVSAINTSMGVAPTFGVGWKADDKGAT